MLAGAVWVCAIVVVCVFIPGVMLESLDLIRPS
jgi:hypothetical protein